MLLGNKPKPAKSYPGANELERKDAELAAREENSSKKETEETQEESDVNCLIQKQISHELKNQRLYLWLSVNLAAIGLPVFSKIMMDWSKEEGEHAVAFCSHLLSLGKTPDVEGTEFEAPSIFEEVDTDDCETEEEACLVCDVLELITKAEKQTTARIKKIFKQVNEDGEFEAVDLVQRFSKEQVEETRKINSLVDMWVNSDRSLVDFELSLKEYRDNEDLFTRGFGYKL